MQDDQNGRRPKWKMTKMEDDQNQRRPKWKTTKIEDDQNGRRPKGIHIVLEWLCGQRLTKNVSFVSSARDFFFNIGDFLC